MMIVFLLALLLASCAGSSSGLNISENTDTNSDTNTRTSVLERAEEQYRSDYAVAIIRTSLLHRSSYIEYYSNDLELLVAVEYPYACLDMGSMSPSAVSGGKACLIPAGLMGHLDDRMVASLDIETGEVREYRIDLVAIDAIGVNDRYAFVANDINGVGHVGRIDLDTGETHTVELGNAPGKLVCAGDRIYVFWLEYGHDGAPDNIHLSCLDESLSLRSSVNMTAEGIDIPALPTALTGGRIYFVSYRQPKDDLEAVKNTIAYYATEDNSIGHFADPAQGAEGYEVSHLIPYGDRVLALGAYPSVDLSRRTGLIEVYDTASGDAVGSLASDIAPSCGVIAGDDLYVKGVASGEVVLARYRIDGTSLVEEKRMYFAQNGSPASDPNGIRYNYSDLFVR
jgi:hypothetical protein